MLYDDYANTINADLLPRQALTRWATSTTDIRKQESKSSTRWNGDNLPFVQVVQDVDALYTREIDVARIDTLESQFEKWQV